VDFKSEDEGSISEEVPKMMDLGTISTVAEHESEDMTDGVPCEVGLTKESLMQSDEPERLRTINRMTGACPDLL
jgi:hypothetical protein